MCQVHTAGLYGLHGAGVAKHLGHDVHHAAGQSPNPIPSSVMDHIDIVTGMLIVAVSSRMTILIAVLEWCCWGLYCRLQGIPLGSSS